MPAHPFIHPLSDLPDPLPIPPRPRGRFHATIRPPGSKSLTNRALLLAALADGTSTLRGPLTDADDAQVMIRALTQLGARIELQSPDPGSSPHAAASLAPSPPLPTLHITGVGGRWKLARGDTVTLDLHNAGTATRFLTAAAMLAPPRTAIIIDGDARMRERPIRELVDLLTAMGVRADYLGKAGYPPVRIQPPDAAGDLASLQTRQRLGTTASSQFISAVMLVAPLLPLGVELELQQPVTSFPYIEMSRRLLDIALGRTTAHVEHPSNQLVIIRVPSLERPIPAFTLDIEPDASGATYFEAAAALFDGSSVTIDGLDLGPRGTLQGDTHFVRVIADMGGKVERIGSGLRASLRITGASHLRPIDTSLADMPDTAMTAAVLCCFAAPTANNPHATSTLRGLRTLRVKETDRLEALRIELTKLGARVEILPDGDDEALRITPPDPRALEARTESSPPITFDTYNDHRMAMALALIGLRVPGVFINNPGCVAKTYPGYWADLARIYEPAPVGHRP